MEDKLKAEEVADPNRLTTHFHAAPPSTGGNVRVRLHPGADVKDQNGKVISRIPPSSAVDVLTRKMKGPGEEAVIPRWKYEALPAMGELLGDAAETPEPEPAKKPKGEK